MNALKALLRIAPEPEDRGSVLELLRRTPVDQLDRTVERLKKRQPAENVRAAMIEMIARAPLADFEMLKAVYLKHCADAVK